MRKAVTQADIHQGVDGTVGNADTEHPPWPARSGKAGRSYRDPGGLEAGINQETGKCRRLRTYRQGKVIEYSSSWVAKVSRFPR